LNIDDRLNKKIRLNTVVNKILDENQDYIKAERTLERRLEKFFERTGGDIPWHKEKTWRYFTTIYELGLTKCILEQLTRKDSPACKIVSEKGLTITDRVDFLKRVRTFCEKQGLDNIGEILFRADKLFHNAVISYRYEKTHLLQHGFFASDIANNNKYGKTIQERYLFVTDKSNLLEDLQKKAWEELIA
jgi:hypothetical protein